MECRLLCGSLTLLALSLLAPPARALDDTQPLLRWGMAAGLSGTLPFGDLRQKGATQDEFVPALWVDLELVQFDIGAHVNVAPFARFSLAGGVDPDAVDAALDPARRKDAMGNVLSEVEPTLLNLGLKGRYFPFGLGLFRPYVALGAGYATLGARYEVTALPGAPTAGGPFGGGGTQSLLHRHQGLSTLLGLGVRMDVPLRVFDNEVFMPVALELAYTHHFWLDLRRNSAAETSAQLLAAEGPFVDYVGLSLTVGFLR
jgi:hypothetical protein